MIQGVIQLLGTSEYNQELFGSTKGREFPDYEWVLDYW
jgi:hypothetical protein